GLAGFEIQTVENSRRAKREDAIACNRRRRARTLARNKGLEVRVVAMRPLGYPVGEAVGDDHFLIAALLLCDRKSARDRKARPSGPDGAPPHEPRRLARPVVRQPDT